MMGHDPVLTDINIDPRYPDGTDTILLSIFDEGGMGNAGDKEDRDVDLYFKIPVAVAANIMANYVQPAAETNTSEDATASAGASSDSDSGSSGACFISTAVI